MTSRNKILVGEKTELKKFDGGLGEYFFKKIGQFGSKTFQINADTGEEQTFRQVLERSSRVAIGLQKLGLKPKEIVMLCCWNDLDNIVPWFAALFSGAIICSLAPELIAEDINKKVATIQPIKFMFVVEEMLETIKTALALANSKPFIIVIGKSKNEYKNMSDMEKTFVLEEKTFRPIKADVHDTAFIILSSGTTATPKGVCLSEYRFMDWALTFENSGLTGTIVQKTCMYWISAVFTTYQMVATGACKVVAKVYTPLKFLESLSKYKVQIALCSDGSYYAILKILKNSPTKFDFSSLLIFYLGGSVIEKELILQFRELFPTPTKVLNLYGSTETGSLTYFPKGDPVAYAKVNSIGIVKENIELKFVDLGTGQLVGPHEEGEMYVKTPFIMKNYYNFENSDVFEKDGFFRTGDLAYYDDDNYVYIIDRITETFNLRYKDTQHRISPSMIREEILKHPAVENAVVFPIPHEEEINQIAVLVAKRTDSTATAKEILEFANEKLADFRRIKGGLRFIKEFPTTVTDKIKKRDFIKLFNKASCCCSSVK